MLLFKHGGYLGSLKKSPFIRSVMGLLKSLTYKVTPDTFGSLNEVTSSVS